MPYNFLTLSLLFLLPGLFIYVARPDLRRLIGTTALISLPFATTEFLFYPTYWQPRTLFDLVPRIGFGIEDLLFVAGLGMLAAGVYPAVAGRRFLWPGGPRALLARESLLRLGGLLGVTAIAVAAAALAGIPMIYAAPAIMLAAALFVCARRRDLTLAALAGGALTLAVYTGLSLVFAWLIPGVFELDWNTDAFLNVFVLGIPVEELIYGFASGLIGSVFVAYAAGGAFVRRSDMRGS
jgi:hypothetical protein